MSAEAKSSQDFGLPPWVSQPDRAGPGRDPGRNDAWIKQRLERAQLIKYLPAMFRGDPNLERLLLIFEDTLLPLWHLADTSHYYFDPHLAPAELLNWLGRWVSLTLDEECPEPNRRALLSQAAELYRKRGTRDSLQTYLGLYSGITPQIYSRDGTAEGPQVPYPAVAAAADLEFVIVFDLGGWQQTTQADNSPAEGAVGDSVSIAALTGWRDRLAKYWRENKARQRGEYPTSESEPGTLGYPAAPFRPLTTYLEPWKLRRLLDDEKPAHTAYRLYLVWPDGVIEQIKPYSIDKQELDLEQIAKPQ